MEVKTGYTISSSVHEGILEIVITGEVAKDAVAGLMNEVFSMIRSMGARFLLVDVRAVKGRYGYAEAFLRVRSYPADVAQVNTAVVDTQENAAFESFHEMAAGNVGRSLKWFTEIEAARAWLKGRRDGGGSA
jgi:hypothetical protein